ncbi:MAG: hypothetical protein DMG24_15200 [Acidobacteria bacterium]|nr:MAG: hypothetical protein DMG24_15200 [Acidobacteriota bacterium]
MQLRPYRASDLCTLYQIDQACFPPGVSYSREELAGFIGHRGSKTWVAEAEGGIVGFLVAGREPRQVGHIITIDVVERWRRLGIGRALMHAVEQWAERQGLRLIYLETAAGNTTAQKFYAGLGYERFKKVERYYSNGEAAWVMVKWLKGKGEV